MERGFSDRHHGKQKKRSRTRKEKLGGDGKGRSLCALASLMKVLRPRFARGLKSSFHGRSKAVPTVQKFPSGGRVGTHVTLRGYSGGRLNPRQNILGVKKYYTAEINEKVGLKSWTGRKVHL